MLGFLNSRSFRVRVGSTFSEKCVLQNDIGQGSAISQIFFFLMINDLPFRLFTNNALSADDVSIWDSRLKFADAETFFQRNLDAIADWCNNWGLKVSNKKTMVVPFTRKSKIPRLDIKFNDCELPVESKFKCQR